MTRFRTLPRQRVLRDSHATAAAENTGRSSRIRHIRTTSAEIVAALVAVLILIRVAVVVQRQGLRVGSPWILRCPGPGVELTARISVTLAVPGQRVRHAASCNWEVNRG